MEISGGKIEEVEDNQSFGEPGSAPQPELDETKKEDVGRSVIQRNVCVTKNPVSLGQRKKIQVHVRGLQNE